MPRAASSTDAAAQEETEVRIYYMLPMIKAIDASCSNATGLRVSLDRRASGAGVMNASSPYLTRSDYFYRLQRA